LSLQRRVSAGWTGFNVVSVAERLKALAIGRPPWPVIDADKAIPWVELRMKLALANSQREAVRIALVSKVAQTAETAVRDEASNLDLPAELDDPAGRDAEEFGRIEG